MNTIVDKQTLSLQDCKFCRAGKVTKVAEKIDCLIGSTSAYVGDVSE